VLRVVEHVAGRALLDDGSAAHDDHSPGQLPHDRQVVADQQVADAGGVPDVGEQVQHLRLDRHVQGRDGLVEDQDLGLGGQRPGDRDALPLPAGQRPGRDGPLSLVEPDEVGELGDPRPSPPLVPAVVDAQHLLDRRLGAVPRVEAGVRVLEDDLHFPAALPSFFRRTDRGAAVMATGADPPAGRAFEADDHLGDRRLSRAGLAHDRQRLALRHRE